MKGFKKLMVGVLLLAALCFVLTACGVPKSLTDFPVDGGTYTGTATDGEATGTGTVTYTNGNIYEGPVVKGIPQGEGIMIDVQSEGTYTGAFKDGLYNDTDASMAFDNGGIYTGAFDGGKMKGQGKFTWPDGNVFEGVFDGTGGKAGSAGGINGTGTIKFVGGIDFTGVVDTGFPKTGVFNWPDGGPAFTGTFTGFLTGYGDLDMKNGVNYYGPMGLGLLVPNDAWEAADKEVVITYPKNADYNGETFTGNYVFNASENKDELKGKVTREGGAVIENVTVMLDWSFSYRYTGTLESDGIVYNGGMRDNNVPYGAGVYTWPANGPIFTAVENHGWLTGYGVLDMKNGITYNGPLNAIAMAANGGTEFQPYTTLANVVKDEVTVTMSVGVFTGKLTDMGTKNLTAGVKAFFGGATYLSEGVFKDNSAPDNEIPFLFVPTFGFGLYPIMTSTIEAPAMVANQPYVGKYLIVTDPEAGQINIAFGAGATYWPDAVGQNPKIESEFFFNNMTGLVKFTNTDSVTLKTFVYEGGMTLLQFGAECGVSEAKITFENGDVFTGSWNADSTVLSGTMTRVGGAAEQGTVAITLTACVFTVTA